MIKLPDPVVLHGNGLKAHFLHAFDRLFGGADEDDPAIAPCGGGQISAAATADGAPVWLTGDESLELEMGDSAVVSCATSLSNADRTFSIVPNLASVCRAFRTLWESPEGFALITNLSQPMVRIERSP